MAQRS